MKTFAIWSIALAVLIFAHFPIALILHFLVEVYQSICCMIIASIF